MLPAQDLASKDSAGAAPPGAKSASDGSIMSRKDARTITLKIPAPRGQIVDREGRPFAQNQVAYQVALQYKQFEAVDRDFVVNWGRQRLDSLQSVSKNLIVKTDEELYDHYRHRRWLPLLVSGQMSEKEARALEPELSAGLVLQGFVSPDRAADLGAIVRDDRVKEAVLKSVSMRLYSGCSSSTPTPGSVYSPTIVMPWACA